MKRFTAKILILALIASITLGGIIFTTEDKAYAANIDSAFPESYKVLLNDLAKKYPNWTFTAKDTGLDWNTVVTQEAQGNRCLTYKTYADILLSKASGDFNASKGTYIAKDGSSWVSASRAAIAYYMDPRNFLNETYIFQFEGLSFSEKFHNIEGIEALLEGTDLANKLVSYTNTKGEVVKIDKKYSELIYEAGKNNKISPLFLAARLKQETGAKLTNGSISGNFSYNGVSYRGYYNYYNVGAYATSTGSAVANGLSYAKDAGWDTPEKAINGGAKFMAANYIARGQDTGYFQKFNVVSTPYYGHQYAQNLTVAATEGNSTYNAYKEMGIVSKGHVFTIPVYKNMPATTSTVKITKSVKSATMIAATNMRQGPSTSYKVVVNIPKGASVVVDGAVYMDNTATVANRLSYPYWVKVKYGSYSGYAILNNISADIEYSLEAGQTKQLKVTKASSEKVYYETSHPGIATVSDSGVITAVGGGTCQIYAITSSGQQLDMIGVKVNQPLAAPKLASISNVVSGVKVTWNKVDGATYYRVYRKEPGGKYATICSKTTSTNYTDASAESGKKYIYTVRAGNSTILGPLYDEAGISITYLKSPTLNNIEATNSTVTVTWSKISGAKGYYVYRMNDTKWKKIATITDASTVKYTDSGLKEGVEYQYTVRAYNDAATSWYYEAGIKTKTIALDEAKLLSIENTLDGVKVTWSEVKGATHYRVYRMEPGGKYGRICDKITGVSIVDKGVVSGKKYIYTVRPLVGESLGAKYNEAGISISYLAATTIEKANVSANQITISWTKVPEAKGYIVLKKHGEDWKEVIKFEDVDALEYTDTELSEGTDHIYAVRAYNDDALSGYNTEGYKLATIPKQTDIKSIANVASGVKLTWNTVAGADGYRIYRKTGTAKYARIKDITNASIGNYTDATAKSGTKYTYTIRTIKNNMLASYSDAGKSIMFLSRPTLKIGTVTTNSLQIKWSKVTGAKGYYVYRKNSDGKWKKIATITSGSTVTYTNKSLSSSTSYVYTVKAYNGSYVGDFVAAGVTGKTKTAYQTYKTTTKVNYRSGAGTSYATKGSLAKGKKISVEVGYSKKANGYTWYRFKLDGKNYYIASKYLQKA